MAAANYNSAHATSETAREFVIPAELAGLRLDQALARLLPEHSRSRIRTWIDAGRVRIAGSAPSAKQKLFGGERVSVAPIADPRNRPLAAQPLPLAIVHEDEALIVIDKPAGLVVHPGSGHWDGTLANALLHHCPQLAGVARAGIVHRLDKDTSGLLVVAKTPPAQTDLVRQLQSRTMRREYLALVHGVVARGGSIDAPIARHPVKRTAMAVVATGKRAVTHYAVRERFASCTLLACRLETGRTHQIRVHFAALHHPLVGDPAYGSRRGVGFHRQALHAWRLGLVHPVTRQPIAWESPLPVDFAALLASLRADGR
ncbi:MAG TPA: 23S rRNA pseudouridine(1911/1915/1917) synthase RluD [Casimicrobiaceae bacterium]|nr:23S rRNA pseudouridine(1911/1915/1917) synthase RluD [Casimicrobiaceae bacterium]